jgi:hypothetical protein
MNPEDLRLGTLPNGGELSARRTDILGYCDVQQSLSLRFEWLAEGEVGDCKVRWRN